MNYDSEYISLLCGKIMFRHFNIATCPIRCITEKIICLQFARKYIALIAKGKNKQDIQEEFNIKRTAPWALLTSNSSIAPKSNLGCSMHGKCNYLRISLPFSNIQVIAQSSLCALWAYGYFTVEFVKNVCGFFNIKLRNVMMNIIKLKK